MKEAQKRALAEPLDAAGRKDDELLEEYVTDYLISAKKGIVRVRTLLRVEIDDDGRWRWHVTATVSPKSGRYVPYAYLARDAQKLLDDVAVALLGGVGDGSIDFFGEAARHATIFCSDEERQSIDARV